MKILHFIYSLEKYLELLIIEYFILCVLSFHYEQFFLFLILISKIWYWISKENNIKL